MVDEKLIHKGNAILDGGGGWFIGDKQAPGSPRYRNKMFVKYGIHSAGEQSKPASPVKPLVTVSILIEGGPFVHWFEKADKSKFTNGAEKVVVTLKDIGDYLLYEPGIDHSWKAIGNSVVLTMQVEPEEASAKARGAAHASN